MKNNSVKFVVTLLLAIISIDSSAIPQTCDQCYIHYCDSCTCGNGKLTCRCGSPDFYRGITAGPTELSNEDINKAIKAFKPSIGNPDEYRASKGYDVCSDDYGANNIKVNSDGALMAGIPDLNITAYGKRIEVKA